MGQFARASRALSVVEGLFCRISVLFCMGCGTGDDELAMVDGLTPSSKKRTKVGYQEVMSALAAQCAPPNE